MPKLVWALVLVCCAAAIGLADPKRDPYKVLGVARQSSDTDIRKAYRKLAVQLHPDKNAATASRKQFLEVQEAYELLNDPARRAKYDQSGFGSQQPNTYQARTSGWNFGHPFQHHFQQFQKPTENIPSTTVQLTYSNFQRYVFQQQTPLLIQVYYDYSPACKAASAQWEQAAKDLSSQITLARIEWGQQYLLDTLWRLTGLRVRGEELPYVLGYSASCLQHSQSIHDLTCHVRYKGGIRADQLQQFAADKLFELPQVPTVTRHSLAKFLAGVPQHKTTLLAFSKTAGASMALRQAVQQTDMLIRAGRVQWKSEDSTFWQEKFGVGKAPALVFLRGPGVAPAVFDTSSSTRLDVGKLAMDNQWQVVQPLRRQTADPLGCGWGSQADRKSLMQLCVVLVGKADSGAMLEGRTALAGLSDWMLTHQGSMWHRGAASAAKEYASGNLRLTWLDAGTQQDFCKTHLRPLGSKATFAVCGSDWTSAVTHALAPWLPWGTPNSTGAPATPHVFLWEPHLWLKFATSSLKQWLRLACAQVAQRAWGASATRVTSQSSAIADLRHLLSWKVAQQKLDMLRRHIYQLAMHPRDSLRGVFSWMSSIPTIVKCVPRSLAPVFVVLSPIPEKLWAIPGTLASIPWRLKFEKWLAALQQSTAWDARSWPERLRALRHQPQKAGQVQLIAYKPGAGQLSAWWSQPHRYAVYGEEITAVGSSEDSLRGLAEWLSLCMSGSSGLPYETGTPEALVDDDAPEWLGAAMQWAKHVLGWLQHELPRQLPAWVTWETAQLLLPILVCALLVLCSQACSGPSHPRASSDAASQQQQQQHTAADAQEADADAYDRFLQTLWKLDSEAAIMDHKSHAAKKDTGKFLVMMMVRREHLVDLRQHESRFEDDASSAVNRRTCKSFLRQFAQLRRNFRRDKRTEFVVAELHMLASVAWQRQYVAAVKQVGNASPVLVWHPKRTKCIMLDCSQMQRAQFALEQVFDGSAKWLVNDWPT